MPEPTSSSGFTESQENDFTRDLVVAWSLGKVTELRQLAHAQSQGQDQLYRFEAILDLSVPGHPNKVYALWSECVESTGRVDFYLKKENAVP
jgi:hypothetical protein